MLLSRKTFWFLAVRKGSFRQLYSNQHGSRDVFFSFPISEVRALEELLCAEKLQAERTCYTITTGQALPISVITG